MQLTESLCVLLVEELQDGPIWYLSTRWPHLVLGIAAQGSIHSAVVRKFGIVIREIRGVVKRSPNSLAHFLSHQRKSRRATDFLALRPEALEFETQRPLRDPIHDHLALNGAYAWKG